MRCVRPEDNHPVSIGVGLFHREASRSQGAHTGADFGERMAVGGIERTFEAVMALQTPNWRQPPKLTPSGSTHPWRRG